MIVQGWKILLQLIDVRKLYVNNVYLDLLGAIVYKLVVDSFLLVRRHDYIHLSLGN